VAVHGGRGGDWHDVPSGRRTIEAPYNKQSNKDDRKENSYANQNPRLHSFYDTIQKTAAEWHARTGFMPY
jgi:hypothetical protein